MPFLRRVCPFCGHCTSILDQVFETKRKVADSFKETMRIRFDDYLPQWNYVAYPVSQELSGFI